MSSSGAATVEFDHARKVYDDAEHPAITDFSLEVSAGELTIFIGPSGSGKTTAMRLVNRMIELTSGDVRVDGVSVTDRPAAELRRYDRLSHFGPFEDPDLVAREVLAFLGS